MKHTWSKVFSTLVATAVFLCAAVLCVAAVVNKDITLDFQMKSPYGFILLVAPSLLTMLFVIKCRRNILLWIVPTIALGIMVFLISNIYELEADLSGMCKFVSAFVYIYGGYRSCIAVIYRKSVFGDGYSAPDDPLRHMTGDEETVDITWMAD